MWSVFSQQLAHFHYKLSVSVTFPPAKICKFLTNQLIEEMVYLWSQFEGVVNHWKVVMVQECEIAGHIESAFRKQLKKKKENSSLHLTQCPLFSVWVQYMVCFYSQSGLTFPYQLTYHLFTGMPSSEICFLGEPRSCQAENSELWAQLLKAACNDYTRIHITWLLTSTEECQGSESIIPGRKHAYLNLKFPIHKAWQCNLPKCTSQKI